MPSPRGLDTKQTMGSNCFIKVFLLGLGKFYLKRFSRFEILSMYVAKMPGRYNEPLNNSFFLGKVKEQIKEIEVISRYLELIRLSLRQIAE